MNKKVSDEINEVSKEKSKVLKMWYMGVKAILKALSSYNWLILSIEGLKDGSWPPSDGDALSFLLLDWLLLLHWVDIDSGTALLLITIHYSWGITGTLIRNWL